VFEAELDYFIANQDELVRRYAGTVLVIRGCEVVGAFPSAIEAYTAAQRQFAQGSYMLQPCEPGVGAYTVSISPSASPSA
jgi:hypothetical protein